MGGTQDDDFNKGKFGRIFTIFSRTFLGCFLFFLRNYVRAHAARCQNREKLKKSMNNLVFLSLLPVVLIF